MFRFSKYFQKAARLIYFSDPNYIKPDETIDQHYAEQDENASNEDQMRDENFHGFNITSDQSLEAERLGSRENLMNAMERWAGGRVAAMRILDERITQRLRTVVAREISLERQRLGFLGSRFRAGPGFFGNVRNLFRRNDGLINARVEEIYGPERNVDQTRIQLADNVWTALTPPQRMAMQVDLVGRGVGLPPPPPLPVGVNPQVFQLSLAEPEQLEEMRTALLFFAPRALDPIFPTREQIPPPTPIERFIRFREIEATERHKLLSTTVYDPTRLAQFMDGLRRTQPQIQLRLNEILMTEALFPIEKYPEAQALIAYIEARIRARGPADLLTELNGIRDNLPPITEKREEGKEPSNELKQLEKIQQLTKSVTEAYRKLRPIYAGAVALGDTLYEYNHQMSDHRAGAPIVGAADTVGAQLQTSIGDAVKLMNEKKVDINQIETTYLDGATELLEMINGVFPVPAPPGGGAPDPYANLRVFIGQNVPLLTNSVGPQLFGQTDYTGGARVLRVASNFENHINGFRPAQIEGVGNEIASQYHNRFKKRQQVSPRQLLYLFKEGDFTRQGVTNPELRRRRALYSTNKSIAFTGNLQLFRTTNREISERFGGSTLGSNRLNRLKKWIQARITNRQVIELQDLLGYMAGFEKDKEFEIFKGMRKDITLTELRKRIDLEGGISDEKLFEYTEKLKEVFLSFEMLNREGKVSIHEGESMDMEMLIYKLTLLRQELRSRKFFEDIRGTTGNKAEAILKKINEDEAASRKDEAGIMTKLKDKYSEWRQLFSKKTLEKKFIESCREIRKIKKSEKLTAAELEAKLAEKGIVTPYDMLKGDLAAEEAKEMAKTVASWSGGKIMAGGANLVRGTSYVWQNAAQPVGRFGRDKIAKPIVSAGAWTLGLPFRLAKTVGLGVWNLVGTKSGGKSASP